jgi:uncharacterized protein (DUF885 family)
MKHLLGAFLLFAALPALAIPPDLADLSRQIEHFPERKDGSDSARLADFFHLYWEARMRQAPDLAVYVGYRGLEGRIRDFSHEAVAFGRRLLHLELAALTSIDRARLTPAEQLNYDLLRRRLEQGIEGERFDAYDTLLVDQMGDAVLDGLQPLPYMPAATVADYEHMIALMRAWPALVPEGIGWLNEGLAKGITPPRVTLAHVVDRVVADIKPDPLQSDLLIAFQRMPDSIPPAERERLRRTASDVFKQQDEPALRRWHDYLANTYVPHTRETIAVSDLPDGKAYYAYVLRGFTTTNLTPEEIHELGQREVKRIRAEMDATIAATGFKGTFQQFVDTLRTDPKFFYDKPEDVLAGYRDIAKRVDPELTKLFGRLPRLPYGIKAMEGDSKTAPSALYSNGTAAAHRPGWMLVNTYDLKARPKWGMESLFAHEGVPGHHLQYSLVEELGELPEWRKWDVYPVFSEGWGLYAESLGYELGLYKDPYSKFGALNNEIWRAMRLVLDTGIHTKGWTRQQAIEYCRANSAKTEREIENEVDRYIVQPGQVPCYKIGELKIRELRRYAEKTLGAQFDVRAFHDELLGVGQLPLDVLEARMKAWVAAVPRLTAAGREPEGK